VWENGKLSLRFARFAFSEPPISVEDDTLIIYCQYLMVLEFGKE